MESPRHPVLRPLRRAPIAALLLSLLVRAAPASADAPDSLAKPTVWDSPGSMPAAAPAEAGNPSLATTSEIGALPQELFLLNYSLYGEPRCPEPPPGWVRVNDDSFVRISEVCNKYLCYPALFQNEANGLVVLAFRGSSGRNPNELKAAQAAASPQVLTANLLAARLAAEYAAAKYPQNLLLSGYSKGAAEAEYAAATVGKPAISFGSPGLSKGTTSWKHAQIPDSDTEPMRRANSLLLAEARALKFSGPGIGKQPDYDAFGASLQPAVERHVVQIYTAGDEVRGAGMLGDLLRAGRSICVVKASGAKSAHRDFEGLRDGLSSLEPQDRALLAGFLREHSLPTKWAASPAQKPLRSPAPPPASNHTRSGLWEAANGWRLEFRGNSARLLEPSGFSANYNEVYRGVVKPTGSDTVVIAWTFGSSAGFMNELPGGVGPIRWDEECRLIFDDAGEGMVIESLSGKNRGTKTWYRLVHP